MRQKSPSLKKAQKKIDLTAANLANQKARDLFLYDDRLASKIVNLSQKNLSILRRSWAPFQPDFNAHSGFGIKLHIIDPMVRALLQDEGLYEMVDRIATESIESAMMIHDKDFVTTMLDDLVLSPDGSSHYAQFLEWPERKR